MDPGEVANYAVAAHRITPDEPLRDMPSLRPGDTVLVETRDLTYTYQLDTDPNDLVVDELTADCVLDAEPVNPDPGSLQPRGGPTTDHPRSCAECSTDDRMVTFGHLVYRKPG